MKKTMMTLCAAGLMLMLGSCFEGNKPKENIISGGPGIGIDTATVNKIDISEAFDSMMADTIANDEKAPDDRLHSTKYIIDRVNSLYKLMDDEQCCSKHYLALRALAEKVARTKGKDLKDEDFVDNHWTLGDDEDANHPDWSFKILNIDNVTKYRAEALVEIKKYYETQMKLHLVFERDDWYVDNFDMLSQVSFDAAVQVYEEHEVYYNEKEMMAEYIQEFIDDADESDEEE